MCGLLSDKASVYIDNNDADDSKIKELIVKIVQVFNPNLNHEEIIQNVDSQGSGSNIDDYNDIEYWINKNSDGTNIEYIKITGKIK